MVTPDGAHTEPMSAPDERLYPGQLATAIEVRLLADEYRQAAAIVAPAGRPGEPLSRSPYRLLAIQAVELYLNAFLLERGHTAVELRRLQHDLAARTELALIAGLVLRVRTVAHLKALCDGREYLISRYAPDRVGDATQVNRLAATLEEVARKTRAMASPSTHAIGRACSSQPRTTEVNAVR